VRFCYFSYLAGAVLLICRNFKAFAKSLLCWPSTLEHLDLIYQCHPPRDEKYAPPNLIIVGMFGPEDLFSTDLRILSQQLTTLKLGWLTVGTNLFWPFEAKNDGNSSIAQLPHWPRLKFFELEYNPVAPTGKWLFELPCGEQIPEAEGPRIPFSDYLPEELIPLPEDQVLRPFRAKAVDDLMSDFYEAAGRAATRMPCLENMCLRPVMAFQRHWFEYNVGYGRATVTWGSNPEFLPEERVLGVWREAAMGHTGKELEACFEFLPTGEPVSAM
jgi:hypothetical protein